MCFMLGKTQTVWFKADTYTAPSYHKTDQEHNAATTIHVPYHYSHQELSVCRNIPPPIDSRVVARLSLLR